MHGKSNYIRVTPALAGGARERKPFFFVLFIFILALATPVLADYLGPNRTVTETTSVCKVVLYECQYVASKDLWKYKKVDDWSCSNEGKPWQGVDNYDGECGPFSDGRTQWGKEEILQTVTTTHPEATIASALQGCNLNNGWCNTTSELSLNGTEPLSGYSILAVEGSLNGQTFACSGDNCSVSLNEGNNDFTFWALSSWGDSSSMGTFSAKVDTVLPTLGLNITTTSGSNGWYVSPTSLTATGSDSTSGLSSVFLSVDNGAWIPSTTLNEGVYNVLVQAEDNAGNISSSSTIISVDTTTPTVDVSVNGTIGSNGWYSSGMQVSATANDATSGVGSLEASLDGGGYQAYNSPVSFADGYHTVQFKAVDNAGNETETSAQEFYVDTIAPAIDLPAEWEVNDTITYKVQDDGSGLSALRVVIEDEGEKFAKVAWNETVSGNKFKGEIIWNGKFKDGTVAPPGEYLVWVKVTDVAGNERIGLGRVIVPSLFSLLSPSQSSTEIPTPPADLFDSDNLSPTISNPDPSTSPSTSFGGSTTPTNSSSVQSLTLSSGTASTSTTTSTNVLWGATAAALIGWATATALEERKKRQQQEQAQVGEASLQREQVKAHASRDEYPPMTRQEKELAQQRKELQKIWDANGAAVYEANREYQAKHGKEMDAATRSKAIKDATRNGVFNAEAYVSNLEAEKTRRDAQNERMADKMTRFEKEEEARWQAQQKAAEEKQKAEELQAGLTAYYAATKPPKQKEKEGEPKVSAALAWDNDPPPSKWSTFWQGVTNWWNNLFVIKQPTPTPDVSAIQTQAAKTFIAQLTQTAQATPTSTPTAMPTFTLTPTPTPTIFPLGYITDNNVRFRSGPSLKDSYIELLCGTEVKIDTQKKEADGKVWQQVTYNGINGWIASDYLSDETPVCANFAAKYAKYPGAGETVQITRLPFEHSNPTLLSSWWGFGNTEFARDHKYEFYKHTTGLHSGLDWGVPFGTPLLWNGNTYGTIVDNGTKKQYAYLKIDDYIVVRAEGFDFIYGHISDRQVNIGDVIKPGQVIGSSGIATGGDAHLHYEIRPVPDANGMKSSFVINPLTFFTQDLQNQWIVLFANDYYLPGDDPLSLGYYRNVPIQP